MIEYFICIGLHKKDGERERERKQKRWKIARERKFRAACAPRDFLLHPSIWPFAFIYLWEYFDYIYSLWWKTKRYCCLHILPFFEYLCHEFNQMPSVLCLYKLFILVLKIYFQFVGYFWYCSLNYYLLLQNICCLLIVCVKCYRIIKSSEQIWIERLYWIALSNSQRSYF